MIKLKRIYRYIIITGLSAILGTTSLSPTISNANPNCHKSCDAYSSKNTDNWNNDDPICLDHIFPDYQLRSIIADKLGVGKNSQVTKEQLKTIKSLTVRDSSHDSKIYSLAGIQWLTELLYLQINCNPITDIRPISTLTKLITLDLSKTNISDMSPVSNLKNLEVLVLRGINSQANLNNTPNKSAKEQLTNIQFLSELTNLEHLDLSDNNIVDISALKNLTNLTHLDLSKNKVLDITPISNMVNLKYLNLNVFTYEEIYNRYVDSSEQKSRILKSGFDKNKVSDIKALANLTKLETLSLDGNNVYDITPLTNLTNLITVNLDSNNVSDIKCLANSTNLNTLNLSRNHVSDINTIANLSSVRNLFLDNNHILDIRPLENELIYNLEQLTLENQTQTNIKIKIKSDGKYKFADVGLFGLNNRSFDILNVRGCGYDQINSILTTSTNPRIGDTLDFQFTQKINFGKQNKVANFSSNQNKSPSISVTLVQN